MDLYIFPDVLEACSKSSTVLPILYVQIIPHEHKWHIYTWMLSGGLQLYCRIKLALDQLMISFT